MKIKHQICLLMLPLFLFSCTLEDDSKLNKDNSDRQEIPASLKIEWTDSFKQEEDNYLVFFHSDTCAHCQEIMGDVIAFSLDNVKKLYFADIESEGIKIPVDKTKDPLIGVSDISEFYIKGTPTIIEVNLCVVVENIPGKDACLTFLNSERLNNKN